MTVKAFWNRLLQRRMAYVGVGALVAITLAGCVGNRESGDAAAPDRPSARSCPSVDTPLGDDAGPGRPPSAPAGIASAKRLAPVSFGQPSSTVGAEFDVEFTVFAYKQPAGSACPDPYQPGYEWAAVDVQACAKALPAGFEFVLGWPPWSLMFADGTVAGTAQVDFPGFEQPQYPDSEVLPVGQCTRGWLPMSVPTGKRPATVVYEPVTEVHTWTIPPHS